ncbi:MAG TPA: ABC transporter permease [Myxococcales bacterium]|jgi:putative ABC transport system permease protein
MSSLVADLRLALRSLRRTPGFAASAILSLALGIGANSTLFSVVDAVLLRPLPYPDSAELVGLAQNQSPPDVRDVREQSTALRTLAGYGAQPFDLTSGPEPEQVAGALVCGPLFGALGVHPAEGRGLTAGDDTPGAPAVAVLSWGLARRLFPGRPAVGATLVLSAKVYTIVGVMPKGFRLPEGDSQLWVPLETAYPEASQARGAHFLRTVARLGGSLAEARREADGVAQRLSQAHPDEDRGLALPLLPLHDVVARNVRSTLLLLLGAVALLLLIASANFAGLLLARGASRRHELAVRAALGASRGRIVRQLVTESALLGLCGGAVAVLLALWLLPIVVASYPEILPGIATASIDGRVLSLTAFVSLASGAVAGVAPALRMSGLDTASALKEAAPALGGGSRSRAFLVVAEIALAVVLLGAAGLVARSLWKLARAPLGFDTGGVLTLRLDPPGARYGQIAQQTALYDRLLAGVAALPGVRDAGIVSELPLSGNALTHNTIVEGMAPVPQGAEPEAGAHVASAGYFAALRIPLRRGRLFDQRDTAQARQVAVVNAAFEHRFFGNAPAIGKRVRYAREEPVRWMTIVGVVGDVRDAPGRDQEPTVYVPYAQNASPWHRWTSLVVRTAPGAQAALARDIVRQVWAADRQLPATQLRSMDEVLARSLTQRRSALTLLTAFALLALILGAVGVHGLVAWTVSQRSHEFGVRLALGATRGRIVRMVFGQSLRLAAFGVVVGSVASVAVSRLLGSFLYGVSAGDPATYAAIALLMGASALVAASVPAARAAMVQPAAALRDE